MAYKHSGMCVWCCCVLLALRGKHKHIDFDGGDMDLLWMITALMPQTSITLLTIQGKI